MTNRGKGAIIRLSVLVVVTALFPTSVFAGSYPIIFLHGHKSEASNNAGWEIWKSSVYESVMEKIIFEQYGGYAQGSPLNCNIDSILSSTGGETRKIYNFSYYNPDSSRGAIGTNGHLWPTTETQRVNYERNIDNACWAQHLADFIDSVLEATDAEQVDIVAHSMGGLVAHSAIKYYDCASKVRKLLMIATPNRGFDHWMEYFYYWFSGDKSWQIDGENLEMNVGEVDWFFKDTLTDSVGIWCDLLGYDNEGVQMATIAGNRATGPAAVSSQPNDGLVAVSWVKMGSSAEFEPTIFASHSYDGEGTEEVTEVTCTYTYEFIKNWIIDDNISHNGAQVEMDQPDFIPVYVYPDPWTKYESRLHAQIDDYQKALVCFARMYRVHGSQQDTLTKAFPIYLYRKDCPGDPVFASDIGDLAVGSYIFKNIAYDMDGVIVESSQQTSLPDYIEPVSLEVIEPASSDTLTVCGYWSTDTVKWHHDYWHANHVIWFSADDGNSWYSVANIQKDSSFIWHLPEVNSSNCRIKIEAWLDTFTVLSDVSDKFTIEIDAPDSLYAFLVDEAIVGLDWKCTSHLNYQVQRKIKNGTWEVIANGYWGPGSQSFYDENVARDTVYHYRVRSYGVFRNDTSYTDFCDAITVRTPILNAPFHDLHVYAEGSDKIIVSYVDHSSLEDSFQIHRKEHGQEWHHHAMLDSNPDNNRRYYTDSVDVLPCSTYWYKVRAYTDMEPSGYSDWTGIFSTTAFPHLHTSRDSATAFQPKIIFDQDQDLFHVTYAAENLIFASRSDDGIDWQGANAVCYRGQTGYENWECGFSQIDVNDDNVPVVAFSIASVKFWPSDTALWCNAVDLAYYDADSNEWFGCLEICTTKIRQPDQPPFHPFAFNAVDDTVHAVYFIGNDLKYRWYNLETDQRSTPLTIGVYTGDIILYDTCECYPVMDKDAAGNLYVAWYTGTYGNGDGILVKYRERHAGAIGDEWSSIIEYEIPMLESWDPTDHGARQLSLARIGNKTYVLATIASIDGVPVGWQDEHSLALSVYDDSTWETEWILDDTTASNGQLLSENMVLYALKVNSSWNTYYQERNDTTWSDPICVKSTTEKSKFPQGVFDGENIVLVWTQGNTALYAIDTTKIRVIPSIEITYPTGDEILGSRLRVGLPVRIEWVSSDNVGVGCHKVYYSLDYGNNHTQIGNDLPGDSSEILWTVPDTIVSGLMFKVVAYDGAQMSSSDEVGPFSTTDELVFNPSFEEVVNNSPYLWTAYGEGSEFNADYEQVQNGQYSAHISRPAESAGEHFGFYQETIPVEPNTLYWLQGYVKTQSTYGAARLSFGVWHSHPDTNHHRDFGSTSGNTSWLYVCDSLTTRSYEDTLMIKMFGNQQFVGDAWFDNLHLLVDTVPPEVAVSYPNGSESLLVEQPIQVHWYTADNVKLGRIDSVLYSTDAGQTWQVIDTALSATATSCDWTIPEWNNQYKIRVVASDASGNQASDASDECFGTTYFTSSSFEYTDPACLENVLIDSQGVVNVTAIRTNYYGIDFGPHSGQFMYKFSGTDTSSTQNSFAIGKVFPYDFPIHDSTYFSFWLYILDAPTDSGHVCMDVHTKSDKVLRNWAQYGKIIDQTGQVLDAESHAAPKNQWCQYVFTFMPAAQETVDYFELVYNDETSADTGNFEAYIDDIKVLKRFPIPDCWHAERYPVGVPHGSSANCDGNFSMNFATYGDTTKLIIDPQGGASGVGHWVEPTPGLRNNITHIPVDSNTILCWEQYDKDTSLILSLLIHDSYNHDRWLTYAKNAANYWNNEGWVDMGDASQNFDVWERFGRNIWDDYREEYSDSGAPPNGLEPESVLAIRLGHFARSGWTGDHGGAIRNLTLVTDSVPPSAPHIVEAKKKLGVHVVLTWNKVTVDERDSTEQVDNYAIYRDSLASFVPDASNLAATVFHPETTFVDGFALYGTTSSFYLVMAVDFVDNESKKSNMGYKISKFFNENASATDKNWTSLPWHCEYSTVSDLTDDLSSGGDPLTKITNLKDNQTYESWLWDDLFLEWYGDNFDITSGRGYELVTQADTLLHLVGSNNPNGLIFLNENPSATDKNWVSIPYNADYSTVSQITNEYSREGEAISKITNLRDDQMFESWLYDQEFVGWEGTNFAIEPGRGYEMVAVTDTTWNPTEYSNEAEELLLAGGGHVNTQANITLGTSTKPDRAPTWVVENASDPQTVYDAVSTTKYSKGDDVYTLNVTTEHTVSAVDQQNRSHSVIEAESPCGDKGGPGVSPDERKISHTVRCYLRNARGFENFAFTTYRVDLPEDVLTEKIIGSATYTNQQIGVIWFDVGNFRIPWKHGQEAVLIIEATKNEQPYYDVIDYVLDEKVDIQRLKDIKLSPMPAPGSSSFSSAVLSRSISDNDNIIGYSLYRDGKRLNSTVLQECQSVDDNTNLRLVIRGGHETVYRSDGIQRTPAQETPIAFAFSIAPNPFVRQAKVTYALPKQSDIEVLIFDVTGRQVRTLVSTTQNPGYYTVSWDGADDYGRESSAGIYFVRFKAGEYNAHDKILLLK